MSRKHWLAAYGERIPAEIDAEAYRSVVEMFEDAMSRYAQAERESAARVLLGESEKKVAKSFAEAAQIYAGDRTGLQLRGMNMLFEVMRGGNGTVIVVPSSALDSMNLGGMISAAVAADGRH